MTDHVRLEHAAVFGASGTLGSTIADRLESHGTVLRISRSEARDSQWVSTHTADWAHSLRNTRLSRVVWAQGANSSGAIGQDATSGLRDLFEANVAYIVDTLEALLAVGAVGEGASLCLVSSVWQEVARESKLAYVTTKSAVGGLVRSLSADLGPRGIRVNAVLPGVVDSPMTRRFLEPDAIARIESDTPMQHLVSARNVADAVEWLTGPGAGGVHGQSIAVDNGWSVVRRV